MPNMCHCNSSQLIWYFFFLIESFLWIDFWDIPFTTGNSSCTFIYEKKKIRTKNFKKKSFLKVSTLCFNYLKSIWIIISIIIFILWLLFLNLLLIFFIIILIIFIWININIMFYVFILFFILFNIFQ